MIKFVIATCVIFMIAFVGAEFGRVDLLEVLLQVTQTIASELYGYMI